MTPAEFRTIRSELGLTQAQLAPLLGYSNKVRVSELETGLRPCPWHVGQLMQCYRLLGYAPDPDPRIS